MELIVHPPGTTLDVRDGEVLLDGLRRQGYTHRHGCRRGGCGQCKIDVVSGEIGYQVTVAESVLTDDERAAGTALSCRAVARSGPIVVTLRDETLRCFFPWQCPTSDASRADRTPATSQPPTEGDAPWAS